MRRSTLLFAAQLFMLSCTPANEAIDQVQQSTDSIPTYATANVDLFMELTPDQQTAFDALNSLQMQSVGEGTLYSTFVGSIHPSPIPDSSFILSRAELRIALERLLAEHCTEILLEDRTRLSAAAVLAQEEYSVDQYNRTSFGIFDETITELSSRGIWIIRSVAGRRDVVMEW